MTSTERLRAMVDKKPTDRCGVSGWVHMPMVDRNTRDYTKATIDFTLNNGWDFVKLMSNGHYMADAYGAKIKWRNDPKEWSGIFEEVPFHTAAEAAALPALDPAVNPVLKREVDTARNVVEYFKGEVPVLATIFTPLTWFQEILSSCNPPAAVEILHSDPKNLHKALENITRTQLVLLDAFMDAGIDGIFFATQFATHKLLTPAEHDEFCKPYDTVILDHIKKRTWFNMMHVHYDEDLMFEAVIDYDVQAFNWENCTAGVDASHLTSIAKVRSMSDKVIIGGIDQHHDFYNADNDREAIKDVLRRRLHSSLEECQDGRFIFAPGCALPMDVDRYVFTLMQEVVKEEGLAK